MNTECEQKNQRRKEFAMRFLIANAGALITLCAVMVQGGRILEQVQQATDLAKFAITEQREIRGDINGIHVDMAEVKGVVRTHDKEIDQLQRGRNGLRNGQQ